MSNGLKVYKIQDSVTGKIHQIEGPEDATDEELYSFLEQDLGSAQAPATQQQAPQASPRPQGPVAVPGSAPQQEKPFVPTAWDKGSGQVTVATKAQEEIPGAEAWLREQLLAGKDYNVIGPEFNQKFPGAALPLGEEGAQIWADNLAYIKTPQGRHAFEQGRVVAPVNRATGEVDPLAPTTVPGEFIQSVERSMYNMANTGVGAAAVVADMVGQDEVAEEWANDYLENLATIQRDMPTSTTTIGNVSSLHGATMYLSTVLGELAPNIAGSLGAGFVGKVAAEKVAQKATAKLVEKKMAEGLSQESAEAFAQAALRRAGFKGAIGGSMASSEVQLVGSTYGDTYGKTGELKPWASFFAGTVAASLDAALPAYVFNKFGGQAARDAFLDGAVKRYGKEVVKGKLLEGGTEGLQTIIQQLPSGEVDWDEVRESFFRGAIGGAAVGGATQAVGDVRNKINNKDTDTPAPAIVREGPAIAPLPTGMDRRTKAYKEGVQRTTDSVTERVNDATKGWENAPSFEVHTNFEKVGGVSNNAVGVIRDGKVLINTDAVIRESRLRSVPVETVVDAVTFHEGLGHHGLELHFGQMLDDRLSAILQDSPVYQAKVAKWIENHPKAYEGDPNLDLRALEEILAERSEGGQMTATLIDGMKNDIKDLARKMGISVEYGTREVETILAQAHSAVVNGKGRDVAANGFLAPRYMYAGPNMKMDDNRAARLKFAESLLDSGRDAEEVRKATGWHRGDDGKMRFELDDSKAGFKKFNDELIDELLLGTPYEGAPKDMTPLDGSIDPIDKLQDPAMREELDVDSLYLHEVYESPELFAAYPELENIIVVRESVENAYPEETKNLSGYWDKANNTIYISSGVDRREAKLAIIHEVQHAVQDIEGFSTGGDSRSAVAAMTPENVVETARNVVEHAKTQPGGWQDVAVSVQNAIDDGRIDDLRDFIRDFAVTNREAYKFLAGEAEARDTEARMDLSPEERRNTKPGSAERLHPDYLIHTGKTSEVANKYMMMTSPDKVKFAQEEIDAMSDEDLFEGQNALTVLNKMVEGYTPTVMTFEDLEKEVELRGYKPSDVIRRNGIGPGELVKRLYMYDMAMMKMSDRVSTLFGKMQDGTATPSDYNNYLKNTLTMQNLGHKIMDAQGELGRALAATRTVKFTRRKVKGLQETLAQFERGSPYAHLANDPEAIYRYAMDIQAQLDAAKDKVKKDGAGMVIQTLNVPRAIMSSMDFSAPFRQGLFLIHKPAFWKAFPQMFRYAGSEAAYDDLMESITARPTYDTMMKANLALSNLGRKMSQREESFQTELAEKIPVLGRLILASERAYTGFLNKLRADVFDSLLAELPDGYSDQDLKDVAAFVNAASGRGNLFEKLKPSAGVLNAAFFSPRLAASRLKMGSVLFDPRTYTTMNPVARKEYMKSLASVGSVALLITSLAALAGAEVEKDPRSSDFAKVKIGNTRYDILGGQGQYITLAARLVTNESKNSAGKIRPYGNKVGQTTRLDAIAKFTTNKAAPIASFILDYFRGENAIGEPFTLSSAIMSRMVPMISQDMTEVIKERGLATGLAMSVPSVFGFGSQTYGPPGLDTDKPLEGPDEFKMKDLEDGTYGNVTAEDGVVTLDEKSKALWTQKINEYYTQYLDEEKKSPDWETMPEKDKIDLINDVRKDARKDAKADMMEILGL